MTAAALRAAIVRCAANASKDAPADEDRRLANFVARLSASMESLGDHELDAMLWGLLDSPEPIRITPAPALMSIQVA